MTYEYFKSGANRSIKIADRTTKIVSIEGSSSELGLVCLLWVCRDISLAKLAKY